MKKQVIKSNGYDRRRFFTFPKNRTIPASFAIPTPTYNSSSICWSPILKKYFFADANSPNKVYSQSPDGQKVLVHTAASTPFGLHWSKTLNMLVLMCDTHIYTSTDGTTWNSQTIPIGYDLSNYISTFVDASTYLLVFGVEGGSAGYMYKTTDGINWTRSASGTGNSTSVVAGAIGDTVGYWKPWDGSTGQVYYTTNGATYSSVGNSSAYSFWPPTAIRPVFMVNYSGTSFYASIDGTNYADSNVGYNTSVSTGNTKWFAGMLMGQYSSYGHYFEYLNITCSSPAFVAVSGNGVYPSEQFVSLEGEYATYTNRKKAHRVGTWLDIGEHEVWLIGGGAPNASTTVGGTAGCMVIHRLTVTEKWRYCVYVYLGAAAIVDTLTGEFLAYASMLTSTSTSAQVNTAGFGTEVYYGLGAADGFSGAACGPSNGSSAFMGNKFDSSGCLTSATTSATTPPDWWQPFDFAGNPSGTGYPGTAGNSASTIGFLGASKGSSVVGSFGSGGCNTSTALATVGGEPLAIIYSR